MITNIIIIIIFIIIIKQFNFLFTFYQALSATLNGFINCSCNHLTSFGGALLIKPNPIDFDKVLVEFKSLQETGNVAVIVTISVVLLCFIVVLVIVRKADKKDARNVSNDDVTLLNSQSSKQILASS